MKIIINYKTLWSLILLYPILLGLIYLFNISPFFITAPYFFLLLLLIFLGIGKKNKIAFKKRYSINVILTLLLLLVSLLNFSQVRYSMPIFFAFFIFILQLYAITFHKKRKEEFFKSYLLFFQIYVLLSFFFLLFLDFAHMDVGDRFIGFTGSPTTYAAFMLVIYILIDTTFSSFNLKRIALFLFVFWLVYISKTRLLLVFLLLYPLLVYVAKNKIFRYRTIFIVFFSILFFVYPLYVIIIEYFPELITIRYEDARDASFGLRNRLYMLVQADFYDGSYYEILFGKGNEHSRIFVENAIGQDIFPHNDFLRIINDWGVIGGAIFFFYLYRIAKSNMISLLISLLYLVLFYSNMVFNLFIVSTLIISSFQPVYYTKTNEINVQ